MYNCNSIIIIIISSSSSICYKLISTYDSHIQWHVTCNNKHSIRHKILKIKLHVKVNIITEST